MLKRSFVLATILFAAFTAGNTANHRALADEAKKGAAEKVTPLINASIMGAKNKEVNILHISAPPGFVTVKHSHPGQLFLYVVDGSVTIEVDGEAPVKLGPGDVMQEPPNKLMVGKNMSTTHGAEIIVFQIGDKGAPFQVDAK